MMVTTTHQFDIKHTGDELDRLEVLNCLHFLSEIIGDMAGVEILSAKSDLIEVTVTQVEIP